MTNPITVAQAEGFIRRYIELDIEEGKLAGEQTLEWFSVLESALKEYRAEIQKLQDRINGAKIALG